MAIIKGKDYIFLEKIHINEGMASGTITTASLVGTANYLFIFPWKAQLGTTQGVGRAYYETVFHTYEGQKNPLDLLNSIFEDKSLTNVTFERKLLDILGKKEVKEDGNPFIHRVNELEKFKIKKGWLTAGIFIKALNGPHKTMNLPGKENKQAWFEFYKHQFK